MVDVIDGNKSDGIVNDIFLVKEAILDVLLNVDGCFDMVKRQLYIGGRKSYLYSIDGFTNSTLIQRVVQYLIDIKTKDMPENAVLFASSKIPYGSVIYCDSYEQAKVLAFAGMSILIIDDYNGCFILDCREYPTRGVNEPIKDKSLRGSRDGFVETLMFNLALLRRRIRTTDFNSKLYNVGKSSKTDVAMCYIEGRADKELIKVIEKKLEAVEADALSLNIESLAEAIYHGSWFNPFPKFKYSERPDVTAASILEGNIVIFVDNCPAAMIIPTTVFDILEDADDYYFPPITGSYLRLSRLIITIAALLVSPLYVLACKYPEMLPASLQFTLPKGYINVPIVIQFLLLEFAIDGLKLASLNTPESLNLSLSVIAGIVVGEFAIKSGWFNEEVLLFMALVTLANYSQSSFELGYALKFMRGIMLVMSALWGYIGFGISLGLVIILVGINKTVAGTPYLYPVIPMDFKKVLQQFFRVNIKKKYN